MRTRSRVCVPDGKRCSSSTTVDSHVSDRLQWSCDSFRETLSPPYRCYTSLRNSSRDHWGMIWVIPWGGAHPPAQAVEHIPSQVKWFISETPVGVHERTSMKEHLVWHGSKHKIQVNTTKRNKRQQKRKQNRTHFQNKKQRETRERSLTKTKARVKNENRWVQQTHTLTYSHTRHALAHPPARPPTHTHTPSPKIWRKGGGKGDSTGIHSLKNIFKNF